MPVFKNLFVKDKSTRGVIKPAFPIYGPEHRSIVTPMRRPSNIDAVLDKYWNVSHASQQELESAGGTTTTTGTESEIETASILENFRNYSTIFFEDDSNNESMSQNWNQDPQTEDWNSMNSMNSGTTSGTSSRLISKNEPVEETEADLSSIVFIDGSDVFCSNSAEVDTTMFGLTEQDYQTTHEDVITDSTIDTEYKNEHMNKEEDEDEDEEEEEEEENPNKPLIPLNTKCSFKPVCFKYSPRIYELTNLENRVLKILDQQLRITCGDEIVDNFPRYLPAYDAFYDDFQYAFNSSASSFLSNNTSSNSSHTISSGSSSLYNQYSIDYPKVPTFFTQTSYQQFQHKLFVCIANIEENKRRRRAVCNSNMKYTLNTKNNCNQKITFHSMKNNIGVF